MKSSTWTEKSFEEQPYGVARSVVLLVSYGSGHYHHKNFLKEILELSTQVELICKTNRLRIDTLPSEGFWVRTNILLWEFPEKKLLVGIQRKLKKSLLDFDRKTMSEVELVDDTQKHLLHFQSDNTIPTGGIEPNHISQT